MKSIINQHPIINSSKYIFTHLETMALCIKRFHSKKKKRRGIRNCVGDCM